MATIVGANSSGTSTEGAQDAAAAMITAGQHTGITATYVDASNRLDLSVTGGGGGEPSGPSPSGGNDATAVQNFLNSLNSAGGGAWEMGGQTFVIRSAITIPAGVTLRNGTLYFDTDLGAGVTGVTLSNGGDPSAAPHLYRVNILAPSASFAVGTVANQMNGLATCEKANLTFCTIKRFRANLVIDANHELFVGCKFTDGYYNCYWGPGNTTFGDQTFYDCDFTGARFASIAVAPDSFIDSVLFSAGHLGFAPYGFYKEPGTNTNAFITGSHLQDISFEEIGNAAILDEATNRTSATSLGTTVIDDPAFAWGATYKIAARAANYAIDVGSVTGLRIRCAGKPFTAGAIAAYRFQNGHSFLDFQYDGPVVANMFATGSGNAYMGSLIRTTWWTGHVWTAVVVGSFAVGQYVERFNSVAVRPYGVGGGTGQMGVAMNAAPDESYVIVAEEGEVDALCTVVSGPGVKLIPDENQNGRLRARGGTASPNGWPAVAFSCTDGGSSGGSLLRVRLQVAPG